VHQAEVLPAHPQLQLTQRLHQRHGLDVSWKIITSSNSVFSLLCIATYRETER
jgi:hypothetical protein